MEGGGCPNGRPLAAELIRPDRLYTGVIDDALVPAIDCAYFDLTGGLKALFLSPHARAWRPSGGGWSFLNDCGDAPSQSRSSQAIGTSLKLGASNERPH
jgi:plasmid replication initiation protein